MNFSHSDLVEIAVKWLKRDGCHIVVSELVTSAFQTPDALGFNMGSSVLVECKTSQRDFKKDRRKLHQQMSGRSMGEYRYYLCPMGVIRIEDLSEGWGLLYVMDDGSVRDMMPHNWKKGEMHPAYNREYNVGAERLLLLSIIRRMKKGEKVLR